MIGGREISIQINTIQCSFQDFVLTNVEFFSITLKIIKLVIDSNTVHYSRLIFMVEFEVHTLAICFNTSYSFYSELFVFRKNILLVIPLNKKKFQLNFNCET